ncbi:hypothetical protein D9758_010587 [Tetrapyrgos nigripes]|uniref:PARP catalytic domain-containing protein n=1 Tax=Tetrapyrgos nigripes TaxID=182062 RepID=A0A8H5D5E0_9AGAR|nr:hypothetical protein D9758_010587 [Tetrapyrgos nigripes]
MMSNILTLSRQFEPWVLSTPLTTTISAAIALQHNVPVLYLISYALQCGRRSTLPARTIGPTALLLAPQLSIYWVHVVVPCSYDLGELLDIPSLPAKTLTSSKKRKIKSGTGTKLPPPSDKVIHLLDSDSDVNQKDEPPHESKRRKPLRTYDSNQALNSKSADLPSTEIKNSTKPERSNTKNKKVSRRSEPFPAEAGPRQDGPLASSRSKRTTKYPVVHDGDAELARRLAEDERKEYRELIQRIEGQKEGIVFKLVINADGTLEDGSPAHPDDLQRFEPWRALFETPFVAPSLPGLQAEPSFKVKRLHWIVNYELEKRFENAREQLRNLLGEEPKELMLFHGTQERNIDLILKGGFRIGGMNGHPLTNGAACGHGIYLAKHGAMSMGYAVDGNRIFACRVLPGLTTKSMAYSSRLPPSTELGYEKYHSWTDDDSVYVVRYTTLVLPCYMIEYDQPGYTQLYANNIALRLVAPAPAPATIPMPVAALPPGIGLGAGGLLGGLLANANAMINPPPNILNRLGFLNGVAVDPTPAIHSRPPRRTTSSTRIRRRATDKSTTAAMGANAGVSMGNRTGETSEGGSGSTTHKSRSRTAAFNEDDNNGDEEEDEPAQMTAVNAKGKGKAPSRAKN